jgi:hypothetical protein
LADTRAFPRFGFFALAAGLGCSSAALPSAVPAPSTQSVAATPAKPTGERVTHAPPRLEKSFTGQAQPSLVVKNGFPIAQHVFVDRVEQAVLAPAASQRFELSIGAHTITCADSTDADDNPAAVTESFDTGYAYSYEIHPSS